MKFYDTSRPLYLETDASDVSIGDRLLQLREGMNCGHDEVPDNATPCPISFASKSQLSAMWYYINTKQEGLGILYSLEKFHHYCFPKELCVITNHMPLVAIISKEVVILSEYLQYIMLHLHQYKVCFLYKAGADL